MPTNFEKETNRYLIFTQLRLHAEMSKQSRFDVFAGIAHVLSDQFLAVQLPPVSHTAELALILWLLYYNIQFS